MTNVPESGPTIDPDPVVQRLVTPACYVLPGGDIRTVPGTPAAASYRAAVIEHLRERARVVCAQHGLRVAFVFGSLATPYFDPGDGSDIDIAVRRDPVRRPAPLEYLEPADISSGFARGTGRTEVFASDLENVKAPLMVLRATQGHPIFGPEEVVEEERARARQVYNDNRDLFARDISIACAHIGLKVIPPPLADFSRVDRAVLMAKVINSTAKMTCVQEMLSMVSKIFRKRKVIRRDALGARIRYVCRPVHGMFRTVARGVVEPEKYRREIGWVLGTVVELELLDRKDIPFILGLPTIDDSFRQISREEAREIVDRLPGIYRRTVEMIGVPDVLDPGNF